MATRLPFVLMDLQSQIADACGGSSPPKIEIWLDAPTFRGVETALNEHYSGNGALIGDRTADALARSASDCLARTIEGKMICAGVIIRRKS